jgi:hypothetical protein
MYSITTVSLDGLFLFNVKIYTYMMNQTDYYLCLLLLFENVRNILSCTRGLLYFRPAILAIKLLKGNQMEEERKDMGKK